MRLPGIHSAPYLLVSSFALAVIGCGGGSAPSAGGQTDTTTPPTGTTKQYLPDVANPVNAIVTVEAENAVTAVVPVEGGTLTTTSTDGTVYTLTIPPGALVDPVTITMTPIHSVAGIDFFSGSWIGVRLEPDGLHLLQPGSLHMVPPGGERVDAFGFSSNGDGSEFHGQPLVPDASVLRMPLYHFSDNGVRFCGGDCGGSLQAPMPATPTEWEARLQNILEELIREERERQLFGKPSDATIASLLEPVLKEYWKRVIEPALPRMLTDCDFAQENLWRPIAFARQVDLVGLGTAFSAEKDQVHRTYLAALENCFVQTAQPCIDHTNADQMAKLYEFQRAYQVVGGKPPFDADNPDLACGWIWVGTSRVDFSPGGNPATSLSSCRASVVLEISPSESTENSVVLHPKSGSVTWNSLSVDGGCTTTSTGTVPLLPQDGTVTVSLNETGATYGGEGVFYRDGPVATYNVHCPDGDSSYTAPVGGMWLSIPDITPLTTWPDITKTNSGVVDTPPFYSEWSFSR